MSEKVDVPKGIAQLHDPTKECRFEETDVSEYRGSVLYVARGLPQDRGQSVSLDKAPVIVGRDPDCGLVLHDQNISRQHARLTLCGSGILVEDLGSKNGVRYLGKRIECATLRMGTRLVMGETAIDLLPLGDATAVPLSTADRYGDLLGTSLVMRSVFTTLEALEKSDAPVLIEGETGTGKELVARALHDHGLRAGRKLVVIDCGVIPHELMESELFGHRKGAFTGADRDRPGAFEEANGGTVFLDELGELPLMLQPKLLRALETGQIKRLGDEGVKKVDVRVIAATKRHLIDEVAQGRFRDDLYYRVAVVKLRLPPLRDRRQDIPMLVDHLIRSLSGNKMSRLSQESVEYLLRCDWPGNVRELRNVLQGALALQREGTAARLRIDPIPGAGTLARLPTPDREAPDTDQALGSGLPFRPAREQVILSFERDYLGRLWTESGGNLSAAARSAGIDRKYLRDLLKKHDLY